jgi:hypothetical protein
MHIKSRNSCSVGVYTASQYSCCYTSIVHNIVYTHFISLCLYYSSFCLDIRHDRWRMIQEPFSIRSFSPLLVVPFLFILMRNIIRRCISIPNALSFPLFYSFSIPRTIPNSRNAPCSFEGNSHDQLFKCITQTREAKPFAILSLSIHLYAVMIWIDLNGLFEWVCLCACCLKHDINVQWREHQN